MKPTILITAGSPDNEELFQCSMDFNRVCRKRFNKYNFKFAVFYPDKKIVFPDNLDEENLKKSEKINLHQFNLKIHEIKPDAIIHGLYGSTGTTSYRKMLEDLGLYVIGSASEKHYISGNKVAARLLFQRFGVPVAPGYIVRKEERSFFQDLHKIEFPVVVKVPCLEDSTGVFLCRNKEELEVSVDKAFNLEDMIIIEKFIYGRELRCGVLENEDGDKIFLPIVQYGIGQDKIRGFEDKRTIHPDGTSSLANAEKWFIDSSLEENKEMVKHVENVVMKAYSALDLKDFGLFDLRLDEKGQAYILEANLFCSFAEKSWLNKMTTEFGITDEKLLDIVMAKARKQQQK